MTEIASPDVSTLYKGAKQITSEMTNPLHTDYNMRFLSNAQMAAVDDAKTRILKVFQDAGMPVEIKISNNFCRFRKIHSFVNFYVMLPSEGDTFDDWFSIDFHVPFQEDRVPDIQAEINRQKLQPIDAYQSYLADIRPLLHTVGAPFIADAIASLEAQALELGIPSTFQIGKVHRSSKFKSTGQSWELSVTFETVMNNEDFESQITQSEAYMRLAPDENGGLERVDQDCLKLRTPSEVEKARRLYKEGARTLADFGLTTARYKVDRFLARRLDRAVPDWRDRIGIVIATDGWHPADKVFPELAGSGIEISYQNKCLSSAISLGTNANWQSGTLCLKKNSLAEVMQSALMGRPLSDLIEVPEISDFVIKNMYVAKGKNGVRNLMVYLEKPFEPIYAGRDIKLAA